MAVTPGTIQTESRRLFAGANAVLQAAIAVALCILIVYVAQQYRWQVDLSQDGINSLSPRTRHMLSRLEQPVRITALFGEPNKQNAIDTKRRRFVQDLLELYDASGRGNVSTQMIDPATQLAEVNRIITRLSSLTTLSEETAPHQAAIEEFLKLQEELRAYYTAERKRVQDLIDAAPALAARPEAAVVVKNFDAFLLDLDDALRSIKEAQQQSIPRYSIAISAVRTSLNAVQRGLKPTVDWLGSQGANVAGLTPEQKNDLLAAPERFKQIQPRIDEVLNTLNPLDTGKLERLYLELSEWSRRPCILVEASGSAAVVSFDEVWMPRVSGDVDPDGEVRDFAGESAVSSAILRLTQQDRTAVVFVRYGGIPLTTQPDAMMQALSPDARPPFAIISKLLEQQNFLVAEWDISTGATPPTLENARHTVYVVFPPRVAMPLDMQQPNAMPRRIREEERTALINAVNAAGKAMFLVGWSQPDQSNPSAPGVYEFAEYLRTDWGVRTLHTYLTLRFARDPSGRTPSGWLPTAQDPVVITSERLRFHNHPITSALELYVCGLPYAAPVRIVDEGERPANITYQTMIEVASTDSIWAVASLDALTEDLRNKRFTEPKSADIMPPFALGLTAKKKDGPTIVILSSEFFAADQFLNQASEFIATQRGPQAVPDFPGNADLFVNAVHWLTGDSERISVGAKTSAVPRITGLNEAQAGAWRTFLATGWPAIALLVGAGVWLIRRR